MAPKPIAYTWDVWRTGSKSWLVLLANKRTGDQIVYTVNGDDKVQLLPITESLPDIRLFYPAVQRNVPPRARAIIRGLAPFDFDNSVKWSSPNQSQLVSDLYKRAKSQTVNGGLRIPVEG
jgi:hypothetical protein